MANNPVARKLYSAIMLICMVVSTLQPTLMVSAHGSAPESRTSDLPGFVESAQDFSELKAPLAQGTVIPTEEAESPQLETTPEPALQEEDTGEEAVNAQGEGEIVHAMGSEFISIRVPDGLIQAYDFAQNTELTFSIYQGGSKVWEANYITDENGQVHIEPEDHEIIPTEGMVYEVTDGVTTHSVTVVPLDVDGVDFDNDTVWGTASPGTTVFGGGGNEFTENGVNVTADTNGVWLADLTTVGFDLTEDMQPWGRIFDPENDLVHAILLYPRIEANPGCDEIYLHEFTPGADITVTVLEGATQVWGPDTRTADFRGIGNFEDLYSFDLLPGQTVLATDGKYTKSVVLLNIHIEGVDYDTDRFWGTADPGQSLFARAFDDVLEESAVLSVQADGSGNWEVDFSGLFDINDQNWFVAVVVDEDSDETLAEWRQPRTPRVAASLQENWINLWDFQPSEEVSLTIKDGETVLYGPNTFTMNGNGSRWVDGWEYSIDLVPGLTIEAAGSSFTKNLILSSIEIQSVDYEADDVFGVGEAGTTIRVWAHDDETDTDIGQDIVVAGDSNWSADFSGMFDLNMAEWIAAEWEDVDRDKTHCETFRPHIEGSVRYDWISLRNFQPGEEVSVTIKDGETVLFGPTVYTMSEDGSYWINGELHGVNLTPGLTIEAAASGITKTLILDLIDFQFIDFEADDVSGVGEAGSNIRVCVHDDATNTGECLHDIQVAGDGSWSADFSGVFDIQFGMGVWAYRDDEDGDSTVSEVPNIPHIEASLINNWIYFWDFQPTEEVSLTIKDGDTVLFGPSTYTMNGDGTYVVGNDVTHVDLVPGLTIEATGSSITKTLVMSSIAIQFVDYEADDVFGIAEAGSSIQVCFNDEETSYGDCLDNIAVAGDGSWSADFSGIFDIHDGIWLGASHNDEDNDTTLGEQHGIAHIEASAVSEWIGGWNFNSNTELIFTVKDGDTTVFGPQTVTTRGDGSFWFEVWRTSFELEPGMTVTATDGLWTKELYLEGVSIDEVDEDNDQIFGSAPSLAALRVEANTGPDSNGVGMDIDADDQGNWSADFSGQLDIRYGVWMGVRMEDEDRDTSVYDMEIRADGVIIASVFRGFLTVQ